MGTLRMQNRNESREEYTNYFDSPYIHHEVEIEEEEEQKRAKDKGKKKAVKHLPKVVKVEVKQEFDETPKCPFGQSDKNGPAERLASNVKRKYNKKGEPKNKGKEECQTNEQDDSDEEAMEKKDKRKYIKELHKKIREHRIAISGVRAVIPRGGFLGTEEEAIPDSTTNV